MDVEQSMLRQLSECRELDASRPISRRLRIGYFRRLRSQNFMAEIAVAKIPSGPKNVRRHGSNKVFAENCYLTMRGGGKENPRGKAKVGGDRDTNQLARSMVHATEILSSTFAPFLLRIFL